MKTIAIDAMGGDLAPQAPVEGALLALEKFDDIRILLVGQEEKLRPLIPADRFTDRLEIVPASEVIVTGEPPVQSIQTKKDSSLVVALKLVKEGKAEAVISSGNTGSVLVGGQVIVRKERGVRRAPLAPLLPTEKGVSLLIDCGANVDARPEHLLQFAVMGQAYMEKMCRVSKPKVALLNIGAEEEKGNELSKAAYQLLKNEPSINFIGNIEGDEISTGKADVIVTEAFVGNVLLKTYEGVAKTFFSLIRGILMKNSVTKFGALMIKGALKERLKGFDSEKYGGAPLLGLRSLVVKTHGSAKATAFMNAINQCRDFIDRDLNGIIKERINSAENSEKND